ncbi:MAG: PASTA domain-containing protein [Desulfobacteraceae bacterium]|nr:PASTA domain-containing protein [Desulfobacteraceae bacterium]
MKKLIKYISIFFIAFAVTGSAAYFSVRLVTHSPGEVVLPKLKGKNIIYVLETLTNLGLNAKLYGTRHDEKLPRYSVISQDPAPGAIIKKGRDVIIYISKGPQENIIPDLRQHSLEEALLILEKEEFSPGVVSRVYDAQTPEGFIIAQYPNAFTGALKGSLCNFLVSRGNEPGEYVMPDLKGMPLEKASAVITENNLVVSQVLSGVKRGMAQGHVIKHEPAHGSYVTYATKIRLFVNTSTANQTMNPDHLQGVILVKHLMEPGFLKKHVRVEADLFGTTIALYDQYAKPSEEILVLIPSGIKTKVNIFIDDNLYKTTTIDPWQKGNGTGEIIWE